MVWTTSDPYSRPVQLTESRKQHILTRHPEISDYLTDVENIIANPNIIIRDEYDYDTEIFCGTDIGTIIYSDKYLKVPVRFDSSNSGEILTAFFTETLPKGELKWLKKTNKL